MEDIEVARLLTEKVDALLENIYNPRSQEFPILDEVVEVVMGMGRLASPP